MKKKPIIITTIIIIIAAYIFYRNYDGSPGELPSEEQIIQAINKEFSKASVYEVLDRIQLDNKYAYVPFVSASGQYGMSFWVWEKFKWTIGRVDTSGSPYVWKLNKKDPSKQFIVWNFDPQGLVSGMDYYLIRNRNAGSNGSYEYYTPRIQMKRSINLEENSYGALPFPEEWASLVLEDMKINKYEGLAASLFGNHSRSMMYVGWLPHYNMEKAAGTNTTTSSSSSYSKKSLDLQFALVLNKVELE